MAGSTVLRAAAILAALGSLAALATPLAAANGAASALCAYGPLPCTLGQNVDNTEKSAGILLDGTRPFVCRNALGVEGTVCALVWTVVGRAIVLP